MTDIQYTIFVSHLGSQREMNLNLVHDSIQNQFHCRVEALETFIDLTRYFDPERIQYSANGILKDLIKHLPEGTDKIVGITTVDIYIPVLTFIFGQASLGGSAGIISGYRLKNEFYGMKENKALYQARMVKTFIHELGHLFGLKHCHGLECVMRSVTYVEEIDQKSGDLCFNCLRMIRK